MNSLSTKKGRISWPEASSTKQQLSLPDSIIYYISKNPATLELYHKLAHSCKYFFEKNPIIVVRNIFDGGRTFCARSCNGWSRRCCVKFDISKLTSKIWLIDEFTLQEDVIPNAATLFSTKFYRCETAQLSVFNNSNTSFEDFKIWALAFQKFDISNIYHKDGSTATLHTLIEVIPSLQTLYYDFYRNTPASTMINFTKFTNLSKLHKLVLCNIPEVINIDDLDQFIKNHKDTKFWLEFDNNISDEYNAQLDKLVDTIIASNVPHRVLDYKEHNEEKYKIMRSRYIFY